MRYPRALPSHTLRTYGSTSVHPHNPHNPLVKPRRRHLFTLSMAGFRSFPNRPKATDDEEKQPFLPKPPPARIEAIDGKRSFLKQLKPSTVK